MSKHFPKGLLIEKGYPQLSEFDCRSPMLVKDIDNHIEIDLDLN